MKIAKLALALLLTSTLAGCYLAPVIPPQGLLFTQTKAPIDTDAHATPMSSKSGKSTSISVLGLVAVGDASVTAAARDGGITRVENVEYEYLNVLLVYQAFTLKVSGE